MGGTLLKVEDLRTYFYTRHGVVKANDGVSFSLQRGEAIGLVGESGCGKSVTCLSILRLIPEPAGRIVGGRILLDGEDLLSKTEGEMRKIRGKRIAIILQDPMTSLNPVLTIGFQVREAIALHQHIQGKSLWDKAAEILKLVKIPAAERRLDDYPHQMSGGMRQRVAGAIALSCQPSILIADEPTTSLDVSVQLQYLSLLKEIQRQNSVGLIFVTHDFGIVANVCDKVAVMYAGKIVESANVIDLFDKPSHPYTEALLASVPRIEEKKERLAEIGGQPPALYKLPPGCSFNPRCSQAKEICRQEPPPEVALNEGHLVRCWLRS
jgi:oligopeptide/dipeptide ABC transporter ATP-binding protein